MGLRVAAWWFSSTLSPFLRRIPPLFAEYTSIIIMAATVAARIMVSVPLEGPKAS